MHKYSSDCQSQKHFAAYIAVVAVVLTLGLRAIIERYKISFPWWLDSPSLMAVFVVIYELFDRFLWRQFTSTPNLNGKWHGTLSSSFQGSTNPAPSINLPITLTIKQTWTEVLIILETNRSRSGSTMASINAADSRDAGLKYEYFNEPSFLKTETMHAHRGVAHLRISGDLRSMEGDYFAGPDRENSGQISVRKI